MGCFLGAKRPKNNPVTLPPPFLREGNQGDGRKMTITISSSAITREQGEQNVNQPFYRDCVR